MIPPLNDHDNISKASLAYPGQPPSAFPLTPLLTLPPSFGAAYVGESFSCTLCANNERPSANDDTSITNVSIEAELQTPTSGQEQGLPLEVQHDARLPDGSDLAPGRSLQAIINHDLKEEGTHVLAVTVTYTEAPTSDTLGPRTRTFRKLYQFVAQQAVGVRTKLGELKGPTYPSGQGKRRHFAVEAQIENLTEQIVVLDKVALELRKGLGVVGLNGYEDEERITLAKGDVQQIAFRLDQLEEELEVEAGRFVLAQLKVDWRMAMGQDGTLRTGWLGCLRRS